MKFFLTAAAMSLLLLSCSLAQSYDYENDNADYQDYQEYAGDYQQEDKLYANYAERQQTKK
jgi:hypothetical protein